MIMKRVFSIMALVTVMVTFMQGTVLAQEYVTTPVKISKEKVRVNGKICHSHIVMEKQTLFSIAKAYGVRVEDIYNFNPSLKETGLKKNSIILIPSKEALTSNPPASSVETAPVEENVVEKKAEEQKKEEKNTEPKKGSKKKKTKVHIRKWYEDLDVIAEKYGVTVEAIMKANNLQGRKLSNRQKLVIPEPEDEVEKTPEEILPEQIVEDNPEVSSNDSTETEEIRPEWIFTPKKEISLTLILPLKSGAEKTSRNNMDFYSGVLLAVKDMSDDGVSTELNVYDSTDPDHPLSIEDIENSDIIIGPVSSGDINRLMQSIPNDKIVVSPLDPRAESITGIYPNLIQAPTPHKSQYADLVSWMNEDMQTGDKIIVISEKGARPTDATTQMQEVLSSSGLDYETFSYNILEGRDVTNPLSALMTQEKTNRIFIASESEAFVNDVVRNLNILIHKKMGIVLYAPSKIRSFDTIEVENFHNTDMHVSLGYYIDYENPQVRDFILKYRALFNTEPSQFAFQGYDSARYFMDLCSRYGTRWYKKLDESGKKMLQSTFEFRRSDEKGGYVNQGVRRIIYGKNWAVKLSD